MEEVKNLEMDNSPEEVIDVEPVEVSHVETDDSENISTESEEKIDSISDFMKTKEFQDMWTKMHTPWNKTTTKVGRNDPCPCGSGKKFKNCCMKNSPMKYNCGLEDTTEAKYVPFGTDLTLRRTETPQDVKDMIEEANK